MMAIGADIERCRSIRLHVRLHVSIGGLCEVGGNSMPEYLIRYVVDRYQLSERTSESHDCAGLRS